MDINPFANGIGMSGDGQDAGIGFGRCGYGDASLDDWRSTVVEADIAITKLKYIANSEAGLKEISRTGVADL